MFEKFKIKRKIRALKSQIAEIEKKRERSQSALTKALLSGKEASDADVDYFNKYTNHIDILRKRIRELQNKLEEGNVDNESPQ
ncbi:MAG: hypothetical protein J5762_07075 [Clostridia bacterium]|nr:hypothetical protein [Clostridia bacterium]